MKKMEGLISLIALCLSGTTACYAGDFTGAPVTATAAVAVSSPLSFTHTLSANSFQSGMIAANTVVASGTVALTGGSHISKVKLTWDRSVNPEAYSKGGDGASAQMKISDSDQTGIDIRFVPVTSAKYLAGAGYAVYQLDTPASQFRYNVNTLIDKQTLKAGSYRLSVSADVMAA
ncbi:hypothetical protein LNR78_004396 [Salmonella enterica]|nr:hypothetical protein [Salmonella enterica]ECJ3906567.1 hypothetical protein [Salmonella enterica subsp. enterica serovar Poona]ECO1003948.1 hypothetical protein [Salmonella enterica subsp. enterica serovar Give]ECS8314102.1 hypothetical protein [Salmonella enterica subsp. enterica serovar Panama]ECT7813253.1 hypothetical protein [Salmonella enterica subsp. enterica serovar 9,12:-:1,5]ECY3797569.1 hypothetical protein [Salmonella enterica subsp. enterica serovar Minnesota]EDL3544282.1 hypot